MFLILALSSAVTYGVSDFFGGVATRQTRALTVVLVSYPVSAVAVAVAAVFAGGHPTFASILWGCASGLAMAAAILCFYRALADGPLSVVSPMTAVIVTVLPVMVGLAQGERLSALMMLGIVCAALAVVLVSQGPRGAATRPRVSPRVLRLTVGAGVLLPSASC